MTTRTAHERSLLRVHAWIVALVTLLTLASALVIALQREVTFTSEARIEVLPIPTRGAPIAPDMGTEREVATSGTVADDAAASLDTSRSNALRGLDVSVVTDTAVLVIDYTAATAEGAYDGADAFARSYVADRNSDQKVRIVSVITPAGLPQDSTHADYALILAVGLLMGLCLGAAAAWLWDRVSDRVRSARELERAGVPVVATGVARPPGGMLVATNGARKDFAFLAGRLTAMVDGRRDGVRVLVTSPRRRSGSSAVATSTAAALADLGRHVVLVDADLGSPGSSSLVPGSPYPGFGEVLTGRAEVEDALRPTPLENVRVLPAAASGPTGSLDVDNLRLMLGQLSARSLVVIDGPALLTSPETVILAEQADVVLLVAPMGSLRRRDVTSALRLLDGVHPSTVAWVALASPAIRRDGRGRRPGRGDPSDDVGGRWLTDRGVVDVSPPPSS